MAVQQQVEADVFVFLGQMILNLAVLTLICGLITHSYAHVTELIYKTELLFPVCA